MFTVKKTILILAAALLALPGVALAQGKGGGKPTGTTVVPTGGNATVDNLVNRYGPLAGSPENAQSLVNGLRDGTEVVLTRTVQGPPPPPPAPQTCTRVVQQTQPCQVPVYFPGTTFQIGTTTGTCTVNVNETYDCTPAASTTPPAPTLERVAFTPPTGNMGLGNVDIALAFATAQLTEAGVTSPAPADVKAALMGGQVTGQVTGKNSAVTLPGVLTLRAGGMGWGQIANQLGYKLQ
jgi:hypothetical protein